MIRDSHAPGRTVPSYPTMTLDEMQVLLEQLKGQLPEAKLARDHYSAAAQRLLAGIEELRRFWGYRRTLARLLAEPVTQCGVTLGAELGTCLFNWVPGINTAQISGDELTRKMPDTQTRRLHASVLFLMNLDFSFGVPGDDHRMCKAA